MCRGFGLGYKIHMLTPDPNTRSCGATLVALFLLLFTAACGEATSIQTGEVGKVLGTSGLEKEIQKPGVFRMPTCSWTGTACPKLVRLQVNKSTQDLEINSLFLHKSNVDIRNVKVGIQFQVKEDEGSINRVFNEVRAAPAEDVQSGDSHRVLLISDDMVYSVFLQRKAADAIVTTLREYTVEQILSDVPEISSAAKLGLNEMMADTPIEITEVGFPNGIGEVPEEVIQAKRRLFAINEDLVRRVKALEADFEIEDHRQSVQRKRVDNDLLNARVAGIDYATYVWLKTYERFADASGEGTPVALGMSTPFAASATNPGAK